MYLGETTDIHKKRIVKNTTKNLTFIPFGGLANRINAITSAIDFCADNNLKLKIIWFKDRGMGANFYDLFTPSPKMTNVEIVDAQWYHYIYDRPRKRNLWLPWIYQRLMFDTRFYEKELAAQKPFEQWFQRHSNKRSLYVIHCQKFYTNNNSSHHLYPIDSIQAKINSRLHILPSHTTGIHIRRTDHTKSINESPLSLFIEKMKAEIEKEPASHFYVASDSIEDKKELINLFRNKIITQKQTVRRDTKEGIIEALVELYTLASTRKIYGSSGSSYSILASELKNRPIEILTK
jgi:hypothetical protein